MRWLPLSPGAQNREISYLLVALVAWAVWVVLRTLVAGASFDEALPYLSFALALAVGIFASDLLARVSNGPFVPTVLALIAGVVLLLVPLYANAQAAWGLQLLAWTGLLVLSAESRGTKLRERKWTVLALGMLALTSVLLVSRAQATSFLVAPLALVILLAVLWKPALSRSSLVVGAMVVTGTAAVTIILLGGLSRWPDRLNAGKSLSSARHQLWVDALELWRAHPVSGAGPGAFTETSEIAASTVHLERAHSSILQIGAELGAVGAVLLAFILCAGAVVAAQGSGESALIAVAAWTALAVHSMIDHLYEYPIVTITAGAVLGLAHGTAPREPALRTPWSHRAM